MYAKIFIYKLNDKDEKINATKLRSHLWQFEQTPFTTMLIFSRVK